MQISVAKASLAYCLQNTDDYILFLFELTKEMRAEDQNILKVNGQNRVNIK